MINQDVEIAARDGTVPAFAAHPDGDGDFAARDVYHEAAAEQVWTKVFDMFRRRLG